MTDNENIKRLEWWIKHGIRNYYDTDIVLDLFHQRQTEIERLKADEKTIKC